MYTGILILIVALVVVSVIAFMISSYIIVDAPNPATAELSRVSRQGKQLSPSFMPWSEELRGSSKVSDIMPPCFDISVDARNIYRIIGSANKVMHHKSLLDVISVILCQTKDGCAKDTKLKDRRMQMLGAGGNPKEAMAASQVNAVVDDFDPNTPIGQLLIASVDLINKSLLKVQDDPDMSESDKESIKGYVTAFLSTTLQNAYNACA